MKFISYFVMFALGSPFLHGEDTQKPPEAYDVIITWKKVLPMKEGDQGGVVATPRYRFFWNKEDQGVGNEGLSVIYRRLSKMNNVKILYESRDAESPLSDPIGDLNVWSHFNLLFRKKNITFTIKYTPDDRDVLLPPWENPFEQKKKYAYLCPEG